MILLRRLSIANRLLQGWVVYGDVYFDSRNCGTRRDGQSERRADLLLTQTHPPTHPVYNERGGAAHAHAYARAFINPTPTHPPTVVGRGGGLATLHQISAHVTFRLRCITGPISRGPETQDPKSREDTRTFNSGLFPNLSSLSFNTKAYCRGLNN